MRNGRVMKLTIRRRSRGSRAVIRCDVGVVVTLRDEEADADDDVVVDANTEE